MTNDLAHAGCQVLHRNTELTNSVPGFLHVTAV